MIQHIVMWKFREGTEAQAEEFLTRLAALDGQIECIRSMAVRRSRARKACCSWGRVQPRAPRQQGQEGFLNGHRVSRAVLRKTAVCSKTPYDQGLFLANLKERRWAHGHAARSRP